MQNGLGNASEIVLIGRAGPLARIGPVEIIGRIELRKGPFAEFSRAVPIIRRARLGECRCPYLDRRRLCQHRGLL